MHQGSAASFPPRPRPPCQRSGLQGKRRQTPGAPEPGITGLCAARGRRTPPEAVPRRSARTTGGFGVDWNTSPSQRTPKRELGQEAHGGVRGRREGAAAGDGVPTVGQDRAAGVSQRQVEAAAGCGLEPLPLGEMG